MCMRDSRSLASVGPDGRRGVVTECEARSGLTDTCDSDLPPSVWPTCAICSPGARRIVGRRPAPITAGRAPAGRTTGVRRGASGHPRAGRSGARRFPGHPPDRRGQPRPVLPGPATGPAGHRRRVRRGQGLRRPVQRGRLPARHPGAAGLRRGRLAVYLARVYDAVLEDNFMYAMEYFPLGSLSAPARPLTRDEVLRAVELRRPRGARPARGRHGPRRRQAGQRDGARRRRQAVRPGSGPGVQPAPR